MNEMKYWQSGTRGDDNLYVQNPNYILHTNHPRRFRMPLKLSAKSKGNHYWGGSKQSVSEEIGRLVCDPDRSVVPSENPNCYFGIHLKVECSAHVDYYQARVKDVKAAIRKVKKEHNGEPFVAIVKNSRGSYSWSKPSSLDFVFLDTDEPVPSDHNNYWAVRGAVSTIYTYADLIARLTDIADHLASVDAESEEKRLAIEQAHKFMRMDESALEREQKDLKRAEKSYANWTDKEYVEEYVAQQVDAARTYREAMLKKVANREKELAESKRKFAALTEEE
jgi:hypothetical protein